GGPLPVGASFVIDTTGYQSISITSQALAAANGVSASNDGITWSVIGGVNISNENAGAVSIFAATTYIFPCLARYFRIVATTAGTATAYLRAQPCVDGKQ